MPQKFKNPTMEIDIHYRSKWMEFVV